MILSSQDGLIVHEISGSDWKVTMSDNAMVEQVNPDGTVELISSAEMHCRVAAKQSRPSTLAPEDVFIGKEFSVEEDSSGRKFRIVAITDGRFPSLGLMAYAGKPLGSGSCGLLTYYFVQVAP